MYTNVLKVYLKNPKYNLDKLLGNYNVYVPILDEIQYIDISCSHTFEINGKIHYFMEVIHLLYNIKMGI